MITLIEQLQEKIDALDISANLVSNMKKPRSDNNYGRAAQKLEEAIIALKLLPGD